MMLNSLQYTGTPPQKKNYSAPVSMELRSRNSTSGTLNRGALRCDFCFRRTIPELGVYLSIA
jgi:hypothetical protein